MYRSTNTRIRLGCGIAGACSIREILESFPESKRTAYTTVQSTVYRLLEGKKAVKIVRRISNANIFDAAYLPRRRATQIDGRWVGAVRRADKPVMAHLVESGKLTLEDEKKAEQAIRRPAKRRGPESPADIVAIDAIRRRRGPANADAAKEWRGCGALAMASRVGKISGSVFANGGHRGPDGMAQGSYGDTAAAVGGGTDQRALLQPSFPPPLLRPEASRGRLTITVGDSGIQFDEPGIRSS